MVYFLTKNPNLVTFWITLKWKVLVSFMALWSILRTIWYILWPFGIISFRLVYFSRSGMLNE
jgi:hypothetical protein